VRDQVVVGYISRCALFTSFFHDEKEKVDLEMSDNKLIFIKMCIFFWKEERDLLNVIGTARDGH
jgi:hypothetical protein